MFSIIFPILFNGETLTVTEFLLNNHLGAQARASRPRRLYGSYRTICQRLTQSFKFFRIQRFSFGGYLVFDCHRQHRIDEGSFSARETCEKSI